MVYLRCAYSSDARRACAIIQTRWHQDDLTGRVVRDMTQNDRADEYEVVEFPAILEIEDEETEEVVEKPLWPEFFGFQALLQMTSMPTFSGTRSTRHPRRKRRR